MQLLPSPVDLRVRLKGEDSRPKCAEVYTSTEVGQAWLRQHVHEAMVADGLHKPLLHHLPGSGSPSFLVRQILIVLH